MNSRVRALVWEELRVGGPIVGLILTVGVLLLAYMRAGGVLATHGTWPELAGYCLTVVVGAPLLCSLLLVLNIRNSGHMGGGFSRRILRMPVDTRAAVTVPLLIRLGWIVALSLTLFAVCRLLYHEGPGWRGVLVLAGVYLLVQLLDWTRAVAAGSVLALALAVAALVVQYTGNWVLLPDFVAGVSRTSAPLFLAGFGCVAGLSYAASLAVVRWTRLGKRIDPSTGATLADVVGWQGSYGEGVFSSPQAAQFWYEMRKTRLLLPKSAFLFWLLGTVGYWLYTFLEHYGPNEIWPSTIEVLANPIVTEALPLAALLCAALLWRMQTSWTGWRESRQSVTGWAARHPVTKAQSARARLAVAGLNLAVALGMASALYMTAFLLADEAAVPRLLGDAWSMGATSPREVAALLLGPVLLAGLLAWIVMHLPAAMAGLAAAVPPVAMSYGYVERYFRYPRGTIIHGYNPLISRGTEEYLWALVLSFPVILFLASLVTVLCLGWVRRRSALFCLAAWAGLALALYPFAVRVPESDVAITVGYCLCIAALAVTCWPQTVLRLGGGLRTALRPEDRRQHRRTAAMVPLGRRALLAAAALAVLGGVAWMRWPAEPATTAMRRSQGVPANLAELNAWYKEVPEEENLALRYRDAKSIVEPLNTAWLRSRGITLPPRLRYSSEAMANVLVQGAAKVSRTQLIPQEVWADTKSYWDMAGLPVAAKLHAVARSGLSNSRYWIDLRQGPATLMEHLAPLRNLARILSVEGWVAAVERRPHDAAMAVLDIFPIANSLSEEPMYLSQQVRVAIQGIAVETLETVMNRCTLPEGELARVQTALTTVPPPPDKVPFLTRYLPAVECFSLAITENPVLIFDYADFGGNTRFFYGEGRGVVKSAMELVGIGRLDRAMIAEYYENMRDIGLEIARSGVMPDPEAMEFHPPKRLALHCPVGSVTASGAGRMIESEWRARTQLDMARTALALERYRLAKGRLPERLKDLVPVFLERVPVDPWNGGNALSYRVKENGEFVVYSFGNNRIDQKGEEVQNWWSNGDMTFTVAPPELRDRPQVAGEG
jgi:hypothetical protein